jgi:hypothetical protein
MKHYIAAILFLGSTVHGGSPLFLNDEEIAARHGSVQDRTCDGGFAVTGNGVFNLFGTIDVSFSAHVCAEDKGVGSAMRVSGKVFNAAIPQGSGLRGEYYYHAHCMYVDEQGGTFLGMEVEGLTGSAARVYTSLEAVEPFGDGNRRLSKKSKKGKKGCKVENCRKECVEEREDGTCTCNECCEEGEDRRLWDAGEEITSGNDPKGTLAIFYFQRKEDHDHTEPAHRFGIHVHAEFDTSCGDFADVIGRTEIKHMQYISELTDGEFVFEE